MSRAASASPSEATASVLSATTSSATPATAETSEPTTKAIPVMAENIASTGGATAAGATAAGATAAAPAAPAAAATAPAGAAPTMLPDGTFTGIGVKGLHFPRRWTRPGVHPYDEIEWEIRTASIGNEKGVSVFEQKDVEVPAFWSQLATNVVVSKYFRGHLNTAGRETSVRQLIDRVVNTIAGWAETQHYFATTEDLRAFQAELTHLLVHQKLAFNSPVWFNVGVEEHPQCSACFINSVQDTMSSIMDLAKTEAMLFKFGSGAGSNLSAIRSSREKMSGGGTASGPVSFMRGYDAFAGVVKSGGKTRRAAKMVILDVTHPDIEDFINSKLKEEKKAWALIEAGYDASFTGEAYGSVAFQNANHSVRVTDDYMRALVADGDWTTTAVVSKAPVETFRARKLFREMADAAWVCGDPGIQYDTTINDWNPVSNSDRQHATNPCSEFSFLDDTSCNLASLNLMKFVREDGEFDVEAFRYACRLTITAQEILVDNAGYPTPAITSNSHLFRPLGLGYANLGALLMNRGLAYDSAEGQAYAGAITSVMTAEAYSQSAIIARDHGGPFAEYRKNEEPFLRVIQKHRDAAHAIPDKAGVPSDLHRAARDIWDNTLELGKAHGYRNAQTTLLAPTGTIAFMMDCDTTGIEPDIALVKYKKLVGEGFLKIVNQTVPGALRKLGYTPDQVDAIVAYVNERETIEGAPELRPEHLSVFDCAFKPMNGTRSIHYMGHLRMMSAVQPFLSGAISKTVNMPEAATADEIETVYLEGWRMGLKAIAIYRDNSKRSQPLMTGKKKDKDELAAEIEIVAMPAAEPKPYRRRLPVERNAVTHKFDIAGHEGYITVGLYDDGQPGEIFLKMAKEGSTISGLMDTFATTVSVALQYGVPLHDLVFKFAHVRFEPSGFTSNPEIPIAKSIIDYIFRWMGSRFLPPDDRAKLGLVDRSSVGETSVQPLNLGLGSASGIGGAGTAGSGAPQAAQPASPLSGSTAVAAPGDVASSTKPASEWPSTQSTATPPNGNGHGPAAAGNGPASAGLNGAAAKPRVTLGSLGLGSNIGKAQVTFSAQADAPSCAECGSIMVRNGSCYKCLNCGSTSGCS
jgi:ribonucleoside-diphosphate reductase alpha chain